MTPGLQLGVPLVEVVRSGVVESMHAGHLVVVDPGGRVIVEYGDVYQPVFPRSSNKPLQAVAMLRLGLRLPPPQVALAAASHSGEPEHIATVRAILAGAGLTEDDLRCPPDWPLGEDARIAAIRDGERSRIFMNCSGKHAAMLATSALNGWPTSTYLDPEHPLQVSIKQTLEDLAGDRVAATAVDGCGAPLCALSLTGLARAFARLGVAERGGEREVADAMRSYPPLVGGTGRLVTTLLQRVGGLVVKDGAEGVYAAALPDGTAIAVKIDDGAQRAAECAIVAALRAVLGGDELADLSAIPVFGGGEPVGVVRFAAPLAEVRS